MIAAQGDVLSRVGDREIVRLRTPELRVGVYETERRQLVIFDAAALVAMAMLDEAPPPARTGRTSLLDLSIAPDEKI